MTGSMTPATTIIEIKIVSQNTDARKSRLYGHLVVGTPMLCNHTAQCCLI